MYFWRMDDVMVPCWKLFVVFHLPVPRSKSIISVACIYNVVVSFTTASVGP